MRMSVTDKGTFPGDQRIGGSEWHSYRGFPIGTLEGHILGASGQGFLCKQDLKSWLKIPQRGEYVKLQILHVKLHKKIWVLHLEDIHRIPHRQLTNRKIGKCFWKCQLILGLKCTLTAFNTFTSIFGTNCSNCWALEWFIGLIPKFQINSKNFRLIPKI